jgi:hypothetical protein
VFVVDDDAAFLKAVTRGSFVCPTLTFVLSQRRGVSE